MRHDPHQLRLDLRGPAIPAELEPFAEAETARAAARFALASAAPGSAEALAAAVRVREAELASRCARLTASARRHGRSALEHLRARAATGAEAHARLAARAALAALDTYPDPDA
jgi:hypothetical protein